MSDVYELVDELPRGPARAAAWNAYALQTYADKLTAASGELETKGVAIAAYRLAAAWLDCAHRPEQDAGSLSPALPHFDTPIRSTQQLTGMRDALEALRVYVAFELERRGADAEADLRAGLAAVDAKLATAAQLWIERPPPELRGGIGGALATGLDGVYELGRRVVA